MFGLLSAMQCDRLSLKSESVVFLDPIVWLLAEFLTFATRTGNVRCSRTARNTRPWFHSFWGQDLGRGCGTRAGDWVDSGWIDRNNWRIWPIPMQAICFGKICPSCLVSTSVHLEGHGFNDTFMHLRVSERLGSNHARSSFICIQITDVLHAPYFQVGVSMISCGMVQVRISFCHAMLFQSPT